MSRVLTLALTVNTTLHPNFVDERKRRRDAQSCLPTIAGSDSGSRTP